MAKRTEIKNAAGTLYAKRDRAGQFTEMDEKGRSLAADRRTKAKTTVKPGYGDQGDQEKRPRAKTAAKKTTARKTAPTRKKAPAKKK